jgi:hypothetical protein
MFTVYVEEVMTYLTVRRYIASWRIDPSLN